MTERAVLALAFGARCGWAASAGWPRSGSWELAGRARPGEAREARHARLFANFGDRFTAALDRSQAGVVVVERPAPRLRGEALELHRGLRGVLLSVCWLRHLEAVELPAGSWRAGLESPADADPETVARALRAWWQVTAAREDQAA